MKTYKRVLMLKEKDGSRYVPIWVGHFEADQIAIFMQNVPVSRPLAHDFAVALINQMGGKCARAEITRQEEEVFYAKVVIEQDGKEIEVDSRPTDAVSVALRASAPIFVDESLLEEFSQPRKVDCSVRLH